MLSSITPPWAACWLNFAGRIRSPIFVAFLIIFIGCILIGAIASFLINRFMKAASIKWIDRILGGIFGLLRGWAIASILVVALIAFPVREHVIPQSVHGAVSSGGSPGSGLAGSSGFEG